MTGRKRYPWIAESALKNRIRQFVLDGEAVVLGVDGISDFNALHSGRHSEEVQLYAFDVLAMDGDDLRRTKEKPADVGRRRGSGHFGFAVRIQNPRASKIAGRVDGPLPHQPGLTAPQRRINHLKVPFYTDGHLSAAHGVVLLRRASHGYRGAVAHRRGCDELSGIGRNTDLALDDAGPGATLRLSPRAMDGYASGDPSWS